MRLGQLLRSIRRAGACGALGLTLAAHALAGPFAVPAVRYDTPALAPGRSDFTQNDELLAALDRLADGRQIRRLEAGRSSTGAPIVALHFSRGAGRPAALLIGQQHGNEPAGAEALLVVAQRLADRDDPLTEVLEQIDVLVLPRANPDGARLARRGNALGHDVNRDHLLLDTPEAQALARLAREFDPLLVVDAHEHRVVSRAGQSPAGIARHDLLVQFATTANLAPALARASLDWFHAPLLAALHAQGLSADWYHVHTRDASRLAMGGVQPTLARNAFGLRQAVSVLLESRGSDLGRQHLERRVHSHVVALASLLRSAADHAAALTGLRLAAAQAQAQQACAGELVIEAAPTITRRQVTRLDPDSGADIVVDVDWESALVLRTIAARPWPCGYWLDAGAGQAVERLRALGVTVQPLASPTALEVQRYRATAQGPSPSAPAAQRVAVDLVDDRLSPPAGSHYVPMDQPLAALAAAALEPDTEYSYVARRLLTLEQLARIVRAP